MIDRIRQDIQERLDQLLSEADRLRQALAALGSDHGQAGSSTSSSPSRPRRTRAATSRSRASASSADSAPRARAASTPTRRASTGRAASGGTKNAVLKALGDAGGKALTASEVAAATGLGRASVSTTLSKLARSGEVAKADRGYRVSNGSAPAAAATETSES